MSVTVIGLDLATSVFQAQGVDAGERAVLKWRSSALSFSGVHRSLDDVFMQTGARNHRMLWTVTPISSAISLQT